MNTQRPCSGMSLCHFLCELSGLLCCAQNWWCSPFSAVWASALWQLCTKVVKTQMKIAANYLKPEIFDCIIFLKITPYCCGLTISILVTLNKCNLPKANKGYMSVTTQKQNKTKKGGGQRGRIEQNRCFLKENIGVFFLSLDIIRATIIVIITPKHVFVI